MTEATQQQQQQQRRILSSQTESGISVVFCVSAKYSAIIFVEAKVSSFSVNHSANAYLFPRSALLNGNKPNYSSVSGWGLTKREDEGNNIFLSPVRCRISLLQSCEQQLGLCDGISCWPRNLFRFFYKGIWKNSNNFLAKPIIFGNNQSFFSPKTPCSHTYSPISHTWPIWLHLASEESLHPGRPVPAEKQRKTPHSFCSAEMVFKLSGNQTHLEKNVTSSCTHEPRGL